MPRTTESDIAAWGRVTLPEFTEDDNTNNFLHLGLFGFDLDNFWEDCEVSDYCDMPALYAEYDGWAVGMYAKMGKN